ncbi:MAG: hypothetical protein KC505_03995 [Myxococcales bacterium]|nr:hypothetical protein [Myxococcales bacterium]USN51520.1 MAG: hypothetical protein H6731_03695 [Myxococcales bacterium]
MAKNFFVRGLKVASVLSALLAATMLVTSCNGASKDNHEGQDANNVVTPPSGLPTEITEGPVVEPASNWGVIELMVKSDPVSPHNERFLDDWRFEVRSIDDQARATSPAFFGETGPDGTAALGLPSFMFSRPLVITAYNDAFPLADLDNDEEMECRTFEILVPPNCYDQAVWLLGPAESALWDYYKRAAERRAEAWNPSQVDCATWLANLQGLILTDRIYDELEDMSDTQTMIFDDESLYKALRENQNFLTPTRPPICMAERRHNGGGLERADIIDELPIDIDDEDPPFGPLEVAVDHDPILIGTNGIVDRLCGVDLDGALNVNLAAFTPVKSYIFDDSDFMGTVHDQVGIVADMDVSVFNVREGNGRPLDHDKYDDACSLTSLIEFTNTDDDEQDVLTGSGVTFSNLFGGDDAVVYLTSDGDAVVDDNDYWAIFYNGSDSPMSERVLTVELLGHRQQDFRDVLHITFDEATDDLFLGLRGDYELNEEETDGERAFLGFTLTTWDGSSSSGRYAIRENIANCYEASDIWARQFFATVDFQERLDECCFNDECELASTIKPLVAAEFAVRSQCFSNSRSNQRWQSEDVGFWSMNSIHGVAGNVIVNPGWLGPDLDVELYIQKFDEAVFKGPRTIRRTDDVGAMMAAIPTLVEGDRVLIRAEDSCCSDYDIVLPCVPEFTGFAGAPGVPYVPQVMGNPLVPVAPGDPLAPGGALPPAAGGEEPVVNNDAAADANKNEA